MTYLMIWFGGSCLGSLISFYFIYTWGWGDAAWGDKVLHTGHSDDEWHKRRRRAFYLIAFWSCLLNPFALIFFAGKGGRNLFRAGVASYSSETYRRWYGEDPP